MNTQLPPRFEMRINLPASLDAIEKFFAEFRTNYRAALDCVDSFAGELLLREALTNAVVHGSQRDPRKLVRCVVRLKRRSLLIAVADDGGGFDWRAARGRLAESSDCSGRGTEILRKFADHVRYNGKGNVVAIVKRLCN